jgi:hypothetical protein
LISLRCESPENVTSVRDVHSLNEFPVIISTEHGTTIRESDGHFSKPPINFRWLSGENIISFRRRHSVKPLMMMIDRGKEIDSRVSFDRKVLSSVSCKTESASNATRFIEHELKLLESRIVTPPEIMTDPNSSSQTRFEFPADCESLEEF